MYINQFSSLPWHHFFYCFVFCFSSVNEPATDGTTPVYLASQDGNLECLKYLHNVGGKCDARARDGMLPVHGAAQNGHLDCIAYLVCWFSRNNVNVFVIRLQTVSKLRQCYWGIQGSSGNRNRQVKIDRESNIILEQAKELFYKELLCYQAISD